MFYIVLFFFYKTHIKFVHSRREQSDFLHDEQVHVYRFSIPVNFHMYMPNVLIHSSHIQVTSYHHNRWEKYHVKLFQAQ